MKPQLLKNNPGLERIRAGETLNVFVVGNFASPRLIDHVCRSGYFDAIWFDLEHFDIPTREMAVLNMVAKAYPVMTIARLKASDYQTVMRMLEAGVDGIMCAMVNNAEEARQIVEWAKFPNPTPAEGEVTGLRGWNSGGIDGAYGNIPPLDYIKHQNTQTVIIAQIETEDAVQQSEAIAAVPGVDALFFGIGDYTVTQKMPGQFYSEKVATAMARVAKASKDAGKWWGTLGIGKQGYDQAKALGCQFICPGGDVKVMNLGLKELVKTFQ
jgi:2-keto-3-deoxy-L-rhamnonate aldolase RhmA